MLRLKLLFALVFLGTSWVLLSSEAEAQRTPWDPPPNCSTHKCDDTIGTTAEACKTKFGEGRFRFYPNGSTCYCPVCMQVLKENDDCSQLMIMDIAVYYVCDDGLECDWTSRSCKKKTG